MGYRGADHGHGEYSCGEDLELVSDLVGRHVQVAGRYVEQVVLDQIDGGGNHHLERNNVKTSLVESSTSYLHSVHRLFDNCIV